MKINELNPGERQEFQPSNTDYNSSYDKFLLDCSDSIAAMKAADRFLYRGVKSKAPNAYIGSSRQGRKPLDTPKQIDNSINDIMQGAGFTAIRNNSVFCTNDAYEASYYGARYLIFPINGYEISWSKNIRDFTQFLDLNRSKLVENGLYAFSETYKKYEILGWNVVSNLRRLYHDVINKLPYGSPEKKASQKIVSAFIRWIDRTGPAHPTSAEVKKAVLALTAYNNKFSPIGKDVMPLLVEYIQYADITANPQKHISPKDVTDGLGYRNDDLKAAIESRCEIMLKGQYYAFKHDKYYEYLRDALLP